MVKTQELEKISLFNDMPEKLLETVADQAQLSIFSQGTVLFKPGEKIEYFYMLLMGQVSMEVELSDGVDVILETAHSGSCFGFSSLVPGARAFASAICQDPCEVITLPGEKMIQRFAEDPELGYQIMLRLARQYKEGMDSRTEMIKKIFDKVPDFKHRAEEMDLLTPIF
ncbi:MAG TPA: cyclic nucleotide-binding domain-containing protein [Desulfobacteraceae bacterium]|nr:cyclic nucleotide-binding domain-containing protein [Desulfobacteraceae bacterium]